MLGIEPSYIQSWTNTQIIVEIPSFVVDGYSGDKRGCAGSGPIKIINAFGDSFINNSNLKIKSSYINFGNFANLGTFPISKQLLANVNCINGRVFSLHTSFQSRIGAAAAVETALQRWSSHLGITLLLERNSNGTIKYVTDTNDAERNVIHFNTLLADGMVTSGSPSYEGSGCSPKKFFRNKTNISIASSQPWHYGVGDNVPINRLDFFHGILHEISHSLGLNHEISLINDPKSLMYFQLKKYNNAEVPATDRPDLNNWSFNAKNAATDIVSASRATTWCGFSSSVVKTLTSPPNSTIFFPAITSNNGFVVGCGTTIHQLSSSIATNNEWLRNGNFYSNAQTINANTGGSYTLRIRNTNCSVASLPSTVNIGYSQCPPGDITDRIISVYPNPSNSNVTIDYDLTNYQTSFKAFIQIIDFLGKVIYSTPLNKENRFIDIDLPDLTSGMYGVSLVVDDAIITSKLLNIVK